MLATTMGKEEENPRFVPLVKESSILRVDTPWLPDDIELVHEKHRQVIRSWEQQKLDDEISLTVGSTTTENFYDEDDEKIHEIRQTRRRTLLLVTCFGLICMAAIGVVFITVRVGFGGKDQPSSSNGPPRTTTPQPSQAPTTKSTQEPTSGFVQVDVSETTPAPTGTSTQANAPSSNFPTTTPTRIQSETPIPVVSDRDPVAPSAAPVESTTEPPTVEGTETPFPDADSFGLDDDEAAPSGETTSHPTQAESATSSLRTSIIPTEVTEVSDSSPGPPRTCNGLASNCIQRVNELMFATLHNAMSSEEDGFDGPSHALRLEEALEAGYRGLLLESCDCRAKGIQLCDTFCLSGTRDPARVVSNIADFLNQEENANEVIILVIQVDDQTLLRLFDVVFAESPELKSLMYSHPGVGTEWPLMDELIDLNKRLLVFQHGDMDCSTEGACPQGVHDTFSYMFETPTDLYDTNELLDFELSCTVQRGSNASDFFILNHYANEDSGMADVESAAIENAMPTLRQRLMACRKKFDRDPSLLVVDHWDIGDALQMVNRRNSQL